VRPGEGLPGGGPEGTEDVALAAPAVVDLLLGPPGLAPCRDASVAGMGLGALRPHLVQADDDAAFRRRGVERLDPPLFSANAGSTRSPNQVSCRRRRRRRRQRKPSPRRISSIRLRWVAIPLRSCKKVASRSSVQEANGRSSVLGSVSAAAITAATRSGE